MRFRSLTAAFLGAAAVAVIPAAGAAVPTVVAGSDYTLALARDGKVFAWGRDTRGQLGSGRALYAGTPRKVESVPPIVQVDGGATHVAAVDWLGNVWTWGHDSAGQLGPRAIAAWTQPGRVLEVSGVTRVASSAGFTAALRSNGDVLVWGTFAGQLRAPELVAGLAGIVDVRSGDGHLLALRIDGSVWTAGSNAFGQLGDGTSGTGSATAAQVTGLPKIVKIAAGPCGSMALGEDGKVFAWGRASCAAASPRNTPLLVPALADVVDIAGGRDFSQAVLANGTVVHWDNAYAPAPRPGFLAVAQVLADTQLETIARLANDTVVVSGSNRVGQHAQGHTDPVAGISFVSTLLNVSGIATAQSGEGGVTHYARRANGELYAWGSNFEGQLGDGAAIVASVPQPVAGLPPVERLAAGERSAYAVDSAGDVWAWGDNTGFALGDATDTPRSGPVKVAGIAGVKDVAAGDGFALFRMADDSVRMLGDPLTAATYAPPAPVAGLAGIAAIAARGRNAFAITAAGGVRAWGRGVDGLIGDGGTLDRPAHVAVAFDTPVTQISVGRRHALARTSDGAAWSWGTDDASGTLGDGVAGTHVRLAPARIAGLAGVTQVAAGLGASVAAVAGGALRSWGTLALGDSAVATRNTPGPVSTLAGIAAIAAGDFVTHAVGADGAVYAWGGGALRTTPQGGFGSTSGDGTFVHRSSPVMVLRAGAAGNLDAADWFLDLDATVASTPPAALLPAMVPVGRAALASGNVSLSAAINYRSTHYGRKVNTYVVGFVPPAFLQQVAVAMDSKSVAEVMKADVPVMVHLTPAGWTTVESHLVGRSQLAPTGNGASIDILDGVNPGVLAGARFCVGYGEDGGAMLAAGTLAEVLAIEGPVPAPSAVPCTPSGVYVDAPPASVLGTPVKLEATVVGAAPTGTVQFRNGFSNLGAAATLSGASAVARASLTLSSLPVGVHSIGANYAGDAQNPAATPLLPVLHTVSAPPGGASVALAGPASAAAGGETLFSVIVAGNQPTGTVQFYDGPATLGAPVPLVGSRATLRIPTLAAGPHTISASYSGDSANSPRVSNTLAHFVATSLPRVSLEVSPAAPMLTTKVRFTANVVGSFPTGAVKILDHGADLAAAPLVAGRGEVEYALLAAGSHLVTATYSGDGANLPATSAPMVVNVKLAVDPARSADDSDSDGIPNGSEVGEGRNPIAKDNDIFASARLFAMQQYRDFLGREGDNAGVSHWTTQLSTNAQDRGQMIETFFNSAEFQNSIAPVVRLYFAYFLRVPDYNGLNFWISQFRSGNTLIGISNAFAGSPEFVAKYGALNNGSFVERVYSNVLGRLPDNAGLSFWLGQLNSNLITRGQMMVAFSESPEYRGVIGSEVYVTMMYAGMLRRAPDAGGFTHWVGYRDQGNSGLALINGFIDSQEYRNRFLP